MSQIKRIGLDTSKAVFTVHGVDQAGQPVLPEPTFAARR